MHPALPQLTNIWNKYWFQFTQVVREMRIRLKDDQFNITMLGFRPGSVIADFISLLQTQDSIGVNVMQTHLSQILKSKFGDQTEVTIRCKCC